MKKIIGYIRVSTNHQDLERQKSLIRKYCEENGFLLVRLIEDFAISGAETDRAGYNELQKLNSSDCDMIVVSELSRLSRDEDIMKTLNTIYNLKSMFDLVMLDNTNLIYEKGTEFDFLQFLGLAFKAKGAADERKNTALRSKTGKYTIIARNPLAYLGAVVPIGFKVENKNLTIGDNSLVKQIYELAADGMSSHRIAEKLSNLGTTIAHSSVIAIIKNPIYKGIRLYKGVEYKTGLEVVSPSLWEQAQLALSNNKVRADKYTKHCNPLKGILKCPCGCNMQIVASGNKFHYACVARANKKTMKKDCGYFGINVDDLISILWTSAEWHIMKEYKPNNVHLNEEIVLLNKRVEELESTINGITKRQEALVDNMAENPILIKALEKKYSEMEEGKNGITKTIKSIRREIAKNERRIADEQRLQSMKELKEMTIEGKADIFSKLFDKVVYDSVKTRRGIIIIYFKNGLTKMYVYQNLPKREKVVIDLNTSFGYRNHNIIIEGYDNSFNKTEREYTPDEIVELFKDNEEYNITL